METLFSMKPVPGARNVVDHCNISLETAINIKILIVRYYTFFFSVLNPKLWASLTPIAQLSSGQPPLLHELKGGTWPGATALDGPGLVALGRPPALMTPDGLVSTDGKGGAV